MSTEEMLSKKYDEQIPFSCDECSKQFTRQQKFVKSDAYHHPNAKQFCCRSCLSKNSILPRLTVNCDACKKDFSVRKSILNQKKRRSASGKIFCSKSCSSKYFNHKPKSQETKNKISKALLSKRRRRPDKINTCVVCSKEFSSFFFRKLCSNECSKTFRSIIGKMGGSKTSSLPFHKRARGLNEKAFLEKLKLHFTDILTNKRIFDGWDADIIIPELKLAIHWNGIFHYKPVFGQKLFDNVVKKDALRYAAIEKEGYTNYIIEDLGSEDPNKVEKEYKKFLGFLYSGY